jgi:agmatinase
MRRVRELGISVTSVGIRSVSEEEANYFKKEKISTIFYAPEVPVEKILATLKEKVYITFDLDGLDPSIMPSTGTPEPGGITWYDALNLLRRLGEERKVIGADVVEHCPIPGLHAPDFLAAKLVYKMLQYCFLS